MSIFLQILSTVVTLGSLYTLVTVGFSLIYAVSGVLHVAQGAVVLESAYVFVALIQRGAHPLAAAAVSLGAGVTTGVLMNLAVFERLRRRGRVSPVGALIASVALLVMGTNLLLLLFGPATQTLDFLETSARFHWQGVTVTAVDLVVVSATVMVMGAVAWLYHHTRIGMALRAVADDHEAALSIGIPLKTIWVIVWSVAGLVAIVAGIMWGAKSGVQFSLSLIALKALPVLILGGFESVPGAIVGGLIIGVAEKVGDVYWAQALGQGIEAWIAYMLALVFLMFRPQGLFGEKIIERV